MAQSKSDFNQLQEDMLEVGLEFDEATGYPILDDDQESQYIRVFAEVCGQLNWFYHCRQCCTAKKIGSNDWKNHFKRKPRALMHAETLLQQLRGDKPSSAVRKLELTDHEDVSTLPPAAKRPAIYAASTATGTFSGTGESEDMEFLPVFSGQSSQLNNEKVFVPRARHAKGNLNLIQAKKHSEISALSSSSTDAAQEDEDVERHDAIVSSSSESSPVSDGSQAYNNTKQSFIEQQVLSPLFDHDGLTPASDVEEKATSHENEKSSTDEESVVAFESYPPASAPPPVTQSTSTMVEDDDEQSMANFQPGWTSNNKVAASSTPHKKPKRFSRGLSNPSSNSNNQEADESLAPSTAAKNFAKKAANSTTIITPTSTEGKGRNKKIPSQPTTTTTTTTATTTTTTATTSNLNDIEDADGEEEDYSLPPLNGLLDLNELSLPPTIHDRATAGAKFHAPKSTTGNKKMGAGHARSSSEVNVHDTPPPPMTTTTASKQGSQITKEMLEIAEILEDLRKTTEATVISTQEKAKSAATGAGSSVEKPIMSSTGEVLEVAGQARQKLARMTQIEIDAVALLLPHAPVPGYTTLPVDGKKRRRYLSKIWKRSLDPVSRVMAVVASTIQAQGITEAAALKEDELNQQERLQKLNALVAPLLQELAAVSEEQQHQQSQQGSLTADSGFDTLLGQDEPTSIREFAKETLQPMAEKFLALLSEADKKNLLACCGPKKNLGRRDQLTAEKDNENTTTYFKWVCRYFGYFVLNKNYQQIKELDDRGKQTLFITGLADEEQVMNFIDVLESNGASPFTLESLMMALKRAHEWLTDRRTKQLVQETAMSTTTASIRFDSQHELYDGARRVLNKVSTVVSAKSNAYQKRSTYTKPVLLDVGVFEEIAELIYLDAIEWGESELAAFLQRIETCAGKLSQADQAIVSELRASSLAFLQLMGTPVRSSFISRCTVSMMLSTLRQYKVLLDNAVKNNLPFPQFKIAGSDKSPGTCITITYQKYQLLSLFMHVRLALLRKKVSEILKRDVTMDQVEGLVVAQNSRYNKEAFFMDTGGDNRARKPSIDLGRITLFYCGIKMNTNMIRRSVATAVTHFQVQQEINSFTAQLGLNRTASTAALQASASVASFSDSEPTMTATQIHNAKRRRRIQATHNHKPPEYHRMVEEVDEVDDDDEEDDMRPEICLKYNTDRRVRLQSGAAMSAAATAGGGASAFDHVNAPPVTHPTAAKRAHYDNFLQTGVLRQNVTTNPTPFSNAATMFGGAQTIAAAALGHTPAVATRHYIAPSALRKQQDVRTQAALQFAASQGLAQMSLDNSYIDTEGNIAVATPQMMRRFMARDATDNLLETMRQQRHK